ncbi:hypothetical protein CBR_g806 [Chara braunii]|uniref:Uncharacterized protein n=1 Tax=Chara braunii TaxID=69332 RepID=A0A388KCE3_CHABU|nr:hypothetical protein CBR_g806 [Chara braunii]|eukprot:GBG67676.1 hypothetical protein CBR_g806 [Chara braunii]
METDNPPSLPTPPSPTTTTASSCLQSTDYSDLIADRSCAKPLQHAMTSACAVRLTAYICVNSYETFRRLTKQGTTTRTRPKGRRGLA